MAEILERLKIYKLVHYIESATKKVKIVTRIFDQNLDFLSRFGGFGQSLDFYQYLDFWPKIALLTFCFGFLTIVLITDYFLTKVQTF